MKRILFAVAFAGVSLCGYAQNELNSKFKPIPPIEPEKEEIIPLKEKPPIVPEKKTDPYAINPNDLFKNPYLYKKDENTEEFPYRKNQYLGSFKTQSSSTKIRYRDAAFVDGDKVRIFVNNKVVQPEVVLDGDYKGFEIKLEKGINRIDIEALNEGFAPPNTAEYEISDDKGALVSADQWNVGTGYKATIIIVKE